MTFYIFIYFLVLSAFILFFVLNVKNSQKSKNKLYLSIAIFLYISWNCMYLLSFWELLEASKLVYLSRFMYSAGVISEYSMLLFILYYGVKNRKKNTIHSFIGVMFIFFSSCFVLIGTFTGLAIEEMIYNKSLGFYSEKYGYGIWLYYALHLLCYTLLIASFFIKKRKLSGLTYQRFKYIYIGYIVHLLGSIITLVLLPAFGIFILQKEQILFFLPFIFSLWYVSHRYKFFSIPSHIGKMLILASSMGITFSILKVLDFYFSHKSELVLGFWGVDSGIASFNSIFGMFLFICIYKFLSLYIIPSPKLEIFDKRCRAVQDKVPFFQDLETLNNFLYKYFKTELKIKYFHMFLLDRREMEKSELIHFFNKDVSRNVFINDPVFIEENKHKFSTSLISSELNVDTKIFFPLRDLESKTFGFVCVGNKNFGDFYSHEEIEILKGLALFLQGHAKYLSTYQKIQDFSINLDKKVDEKTIEYNNLLNKQREFIAYVSHEIRNPITNTLFLVEAIKEDCYKLEKGGELVGRLQEDTFILKDELLKISKLVKHIFSVEKYDLEKVELYKEPINIERFLKNEIEGFHRKFPSATLHEDLEDIGRVSIDETQFRQVIQNLINNALKFSDQNNPHLSITLAREAKKICIMIEDNGGDFENMDISSVFDKYATGGGSSVGLGMGLYLCKRIVELHGGVISVQKSKKLGGACFIIVF